MKNRHTRYQGAVIRDHSILMIRHCENKTGRSYWILPGGGIEPGETEEDCVRREMMEETSLAVRVVKPLMNEPAYPGGVYQFYKTYLCQPTSGEATPGFEPEPEAASQYAIAEVRWFDLRDESGWDANLIADPFDHNQLRQVREVLGYLHRPDE